MLSGLENLSVTALILILLVGFAAGWIDAVVGGGGLLQLPVLLLVPGVNPVQALATNKLGSICGTTTSAITYGIKVRPDLRTALPMVVIAGVASYLGASVAAALPQAIFKPIIIAALLLVALFTLLRPQAGYEARSKNLSSSVHYLVAASIGAVIGAYDGLLGPGTGTFLIIALIGLLGYTFLQASAQAKLVNWGTNIGALLFFIPHGSVLWGLGLILGLTNIGGAYVGARMAITRGNRFVRYVFLVVVCVLMIKLSVDVIQQMKEG